MKSNALKSCLVSLIILISTNELYSQNYIYIGDKQFKSTSSWEFILEAKYQTDNPELTVAKHPKGGYIMINLDVPFKSNYIGGTLFVYLIDGSVIKCFDRGIRDHLNGQSIAVYNLTQEEIVRMSYKRISMIRFSILGDIGGEKSYTANNRLSIFPTFGNEKNYYDTDKEIKELFGQ